MTMYELIHGTDLHTVATVCWVIAAAFFVYGALKG